MTKDISSLPLDQMNLSVAESSNRFGYNSEHPLLGFVDPGRDCFDKPYASPTLSFPIENVQPARSSLLCAWSRQREPDHDRFRLAGAGLEVNQKRLRRAKPIEPFARAEKSLRQKSIFANAINPICPVQPSCEKYSVSVVG
jgi:hypothetical protein